MRTYGQYCPVSRGSEIRGLAGFRPEHRFVDADLRRVHQPTLLIWGDHDPVGDVDAARRTAAALPDATVEILPAGHAPFWGEPARTGQLTTRFLDEPDA